MVAMMVLRMFTFKDSGGIVTRQRGCLSEFRFSDISRKSTTVLAIVALLLTINRTPPAYAAVRGMVGATLIVDRVADWRDGEFRGNRDHPRTALLE